MASFHHWPSFGRWPRRRRCRLAPVSCVAPTILLMHASAQSSCWFMHAESKVLQACGIVKIPGEVGSTFACLPSIAQCCYFDTCP